jgi:phage terminase large subunit
VSKKIVSTGYMPRVLQQELHTNFKRFNVVICHRRFGKTHLSLNEMIDRALRNDLKNPQYAYIAPTYGQAKRVAWDLLKDYTKNIPGVETNESDLRIDIPRPAKGDRIRFYLLGAENPSSILGIYLDGVIFDEYGDMNPIVWTQVIRPLLADRVGWAIFIGTPKGNNHFYEIYKFGKNGNPEKGIEKPEDWYTVIYKASETGIIPQSELEQAAAIMAESEYAQEFECSFSAALVGAYYGKEMEKAEQEGRVTKVPYDPAIPCFTYWDLGVDDSTAIWIGQKIGSREIHWIDYIEDSGQGLEHYIKILQDKKYVYQQHVLPHDAAARELGTGKTREELLRSKGLGNRTLVLKRQDVADGINAVRMMLGKSWFDKDKCARGINCLINYQRAWDAKNKIFQSKPKHDWASHGADSFRTAAMAMDEFAPTEEQKKRYPRQSVSDFDVV